MKLENQVCTLEQAKRLKELGICQESYFLHGEEAGHIVESWSVEGYEDEFYSVFTVAELGVMLNTYTGNIRKSDNADYWYAYLDTYQQFKTEAEARAALLICRLEWKAVTAEEVNKLLQAS